MAKNMKAIVAKSGSQARDKGAFIVVEKSVPEPKPQDLLVLIVAIGINLK